MWNKKSNKKKLLELGFRLELLLERLYTERSYKRQDIDRARAGDARAKVVELIETYDYIINELEQFKSIIDIDFDTNIFK